MFEIGLSMHNYLCPSCRYPLYFPLGSNEGGCLSCLKNWVVIEVGILAPALYQSPGQQLANDMQRRWKEKTDALQAQMRNGGVN